MVHSIEVYYFFCTEYNELSKFGNETSINIKSPLNKAGEVFKRPQGVTDIKTFRIKTV